MREKEFGVWQTWTWSQVQTEIHELALGLASMGFRRGDKLAIIGDNRPRMYWSMCAAQALGGVPVPMYQDSVADELQFVLEHAGARFALAEDQEQIDKLLEIKERCPDLEILIYDDERGMRDYGQDYVVDFADLQKAGRENGAERAAYLQAEIEKAVGSDTGIMLYTSGTTGKPKGVVLSNDNLIVTARNAAQREGLTVKEEVLAYLPMAWVGDNIFSYAQSYVTGFCVSCPESGDTVMPNMREIGPTYFFAPPRIFENLLTTVMIRMEDASTWKRYMFHYFMDVARRAGTKILDGAEVGAKDKVLYWLGRVFVYGPLKDTLGMSRVHLAYTAGEAIGPDIFDFYRALGINVKQLYGQTEAAVFITIQPNGNIKADTVGIPAPGVDIKIEDDGEVLYRGPGVFQEYYQDAEATREAKSEDGWVKTGDAGYFDDDGHLKIIDRAKDVGKLNDGSMFAPKYIENKLKFFSHVKEAVVWGDGQDFVTAFINIDLESVGSWAERNNLAYASYQELAATDEIYALVHDCIEKVNRDLSTDVRLSGSQIKRYLVLHKELDADDGELTRTRKVRRKHVSEKFDSLIEAMYSESESCHIVTEVSFEDGRKGRISADLAIRDVQTFESLRKAG